MEKIQPEGRCFRPIKGIPDFHDPLVRGRLRRDLAAAGLLCVLIYGIAALLEFVFPDVLPLSLLALPFPLLAAPAVILPLLVLTVGRFTFREELREQARRSCRVSSEGLEWQDKKRHVHIPWDAVSRLRITRSFGRPVFWIFYRGGRLILDTPWLAEDEVPATRIRVTGNRILLRLPGSGQWIDPTTWAAADHPLVREIEQISARRFS